MASPERQIATPTTPAERSSDLHFRRSLVLPVVVGSIVALILIWQLMLPPVVGLANNSDFGKLLGPYDLGSPVKSTYADTKYVYDERYHWDSGFSSSELLFLWAALGANKLLSKDGSFDVRLMGFVHGAVFLLAVVLLIPLTDGASPRWRAAFWAVVVFMFCDVMYVSYLNSFYMDVAAYLSLLLAAVLYLRLLYRRRPVEAITLVVCCLVLVTSKPQHAILGFWLAALFWLTRDILFNGRRLVAAGVSGALLFASGATFRFAAPAGYAGRGCFNVVFWQILPHSRDVNRAMADLGLNDSGRVWIGKTAYTEGVTQEDAFFESFLLKVSYPRLARFYLTHPRDAYRALRTSLREAGRQRPVYGNFDPSTGVAPFAESQSFALWSNLKRALFYGKGPRFLFSFLAIAALVSSLLRLERRSLPKGAVAGGVCLAGMALTELLVSSLADAVDVPRHHLIFFAQFDMLLLAGIWLVMRWDRRPARASGAVTAPES